MNILIVNYRDKKNPNAGGAEKHLHEIFERLVVRGHKVVLLTTKFKGASNRENIGGIQVVRVGSDLTFQLAVAFHLKKLDNEFNFDIIVEDLNKLPLFTPYLTKKKVVVQMHHLWKRSIFYETNFIVAFGVWFFERLIPFFYKKENFIVVSPSTKKELTELGIEETKISVIYNGAAPLEIVEEHKEEKPYFLWLSRIHKYKGIWTALHAFKEFAKTRDGVNLLIAGRGPLEKKAKAWVKKEHLENRIKFLGFVSHNEKSTLMAGALALLQTSYKEGWGLTVIEAAQVKTPTIAANVPGLCDSVLHEKTGFLFPAGDASLCALLMEKMVKNPKCMSEMGEQAFEFSKNFSWEKAARETEEFLCR